MIVNELYLLITFRLLEIQQIHVQQHHYLEPLLIQIAFWFPSEFELAGFYYKLLCLSNKLVVFIYWTLEVSLISVTLVLSKFALQQFLVPKQKIAFGKHQQCYKLKLHIHCIFFIILSLAPNFQLKENLKQTEGLRNKMSMLHQWLQNRNL